MRCAGYDRATMLSQVNAYGSIPSPSESGFHLGPLFFHAYGIAYVFAVLAAILVCRWRWARIGGDPDLIGRSRCGGSQSA